MASSSTSVQLRSCAIHNMLAYLTKPSDKNDFNEIIDFLNQSYIHYSLTVSPIISQVHINEFWVNASISRAEGEQHITSRVAGTEVIISEASIRSVLKLNDEEGISTLNDQFLFDNLRLMGYEGDYTKFTFKKTLFCPQWKFLIHIILHCLSSKKTAFEQFGTSIAYAIVCLATGQKFNFSNLIFNGMKRNIQQKEALKFLMYPRFVQLLLNEQINNLIVQDTQLFVSQLRSKVFSNMLRQVAPFSGRITALFPTMLPAPFATEEAPPVTSEPTVEENVAIPSTSQPKTVGGTTRQQRTFIHFYSRSKKRSKTQVPEEAPPEDDSNFVDDFGGPSTNTKGDSADHARHEAEDHFANDSPRESHPEGDEARNYTELTVIIEYFWSKFLAERRKRKADSEIISSLQQLVTSLQHELNELKREVTELKHRSYKGGEPAAEANDTDEAGNTADNATDAADTSAGVQNKDDGNVGAAEDDTNDEFTQTPPPPSEPQTEPEVKIPEPQPQTQTVRAAHRQKSIPVWRKMKQKSSYKSLPKNNFENIPKIYEKKTTQTSLPPVRIREPTTTSEPSNLPKINPKDKGKGILEEEPKQKKPKTVPASHVEDDLELAQRLQVELNQQAYEEELVKVEIDDGVYVKMTKEQIRVYDEDQLKEQKQDDVEHLVRAVKEKKAAELRAKNAAKLQTPAQQRLSLIRRMKGDIPLYMLQRLSLEQLQRRYAAFSAPIPDHFIVNRNKKKKK